MLTSFRIRKLFFVTAAGIALLSPRLEAITPDEITREEQLLQRTADDRREKAVLRFRELALAESDASKAKPLQERLIDKFDIALSYLESLDRNANYDSAHKRDWTQQMVFQTLFRDVPFSWMRYQADYRMDTSLHQHFSPNDSFVQEMGGRIDIRLHKKLIWDNDYHWGYFRYPDATTSSYFRNKIVTGLKHHPFKTPRIYHRPNFTWELRNYRYRLARVTVNQAAVNTDSKREDIVYRLDHEIGIYPYKTITVIVHNQIGFNESNDAHQDFYDYQFFKTSQVVSGSWKKWYAYAGFQFQRNNFSARQLLGTAQAEDLPSVYGGIYYTFNQFLSIGFNTIYFKSDSNYPDLEYQGATFTLGAYTNFKPSDLIDRIPGLISKPKSA